MKNNLNQQPKPQCEGHPEAFPEVTTLPKGWDLSSLVSPQAALPTGTAVYSESSDRRASFDAGSQASLPAKLI